MDEAVTDLVSVDCSQPHKVRSPSYLSPRSGEDLCITLQSPSDRRWSDPDNEDDRQETGRYKAAESVTEDKMGMEMSSPREVSYFDGRFPCFTLRLIDVSAIPNKITIIMNLYFYSTAL